MAEQWGDALAIEVSKRIGRFFAAEADLEDITAADRDEARIFLALAERTLWIWDPDSTAGASSYVVVPTDSPAAGRLVRSDAALAASVAGLVSDVPGLTCLSGDAVNDAVYISAADTVAKADADNAAKIPAIGIIVSKESATSCTVRMSGLVAAAGTFTAGAIQYLDTTAGGLTETPPSAPNATPVGIAINTTDLLVLPLGVLSYILRSTTANLGASTIGITDAGTFTAQTNLEGATQEIYQDLKTAKLIVPVYLDRLAAGTPLAAWADNAGASAPGITLADSKAVGVRWNNQGTHTAVWAREIIVPYEADISANATLRILCSKSGATLADATTFTVTAFANTVGLAHDADSDFGGTSSAITGDATAKTIQASTLTLTAANLAAAAAPATISMSIKPSDGTLGTDDIIVEAAFIEFKRKLRTS